MDCHGVSGKLCIAGTAESTCHTWQKTISLTFRVHNTPRRLFSFNFRAGLYLKLSGTCLPCDSVRACCVFRKYKFRWKHVAESCAVTTAIVLLWGLLMYWSWWRPHPDNCSRCRMFHGSCWFIASAALHMNMLLSVLSTCCTGECLGWRGFLRPQVCFFPGLLFGPEDAGDNFLRNIRGFFWTARCYNIIRPSVFTVYLVYRFSLWK